MECRRSFIGFVGAVMVLFGMAMVNCGIVAATYANATNNDAAGVPMWAGLLIMMCGVGNIVDAFAYSNKQNGSQLFPFSILVVFSNFIAMVISGVCIGLYSWSAATILDGSADVINEIPISRAPLLYSAIIVAAGIVLILSLFAIFVDCCFPFMSPPTTPRPYNVGVFDSPPRYPAHDVFKA